MAQIIKPLYDGAGNEIIPQTKAEAVDVGSGENLSGRLTSVNAQLADIENVHLPLKANKEQEAWITPTLLNGWTAVQPVAYFIDNFGVVHVKGRVTGGTVGTPIFTLPTTYQPSQPHYYITSAGTGQCNLYVSTMGVHHLFGSNTNVGLDVINYKKG